MSSTSYRRPPATRARAFVVGVVLLLLTAVSVSAASAYWSGAAGTGSGDRSLGDPPRPDR